MIFSTLIYDFILAVEFQIDNEIWLDAGMIERFTSPNYPSAYTVGDSTEWVFCVSTGLYTHYYLLKLQNVN